MALTIDQITTASFPAVLADMRKPNVQWGDQSGLKAFESKGFVKRQSFGDTIEIPLDYRPNPDAAVLATDQDTSTLVTTDILTAASYNVGQMNVPVVWTRGEEIKNPTDNQKVALVRSKLENGINTHDDLIEQLIFTSSSAGGDEVLGLADLLPTSGQGNVGGIDSALETWWRHPSETYVDATDIEAAAVALWNDIARGSGATSLPKLLISGADPNAMFESTLTGLKRYGTDQEANASFKTGGIMFKSAPWVFSMYGGSSVYFLNPKDYQLLVSKQAFRDKGKTETIQGQNAYYFLIYSAIQFVVHNKSKLGVLHV